MRLSRLVLIGFVLTLLSGCKVFVTVKDGGNVISQSGAYQCAEGELCVFTIPDDDDYTDAITAVPREGYVFKGWKRGWGHLCGGSDLTCDIFVAEGFDHLQFFMEPIFVPLDTIYTNPDDPRIVDFTAGNKHISLIGSKDADGYTQAITDLFITDGKNQQFLYDFSNNGRLRGFTDENGVYRKLKWGEDQSVGPTSTDTASSIPSREPMRTVYKSSVSSAGLAGHSDIRVYKCGQPIGKGEVDVEVALRKHDGSADYRWPEYYASDKLFQISYPEASGYWANQDVELDPLCSGVETSMDHLCAANDFLNDHKFVSFGICTAALIGTSGLGGPAVCGGLVALNRACRIADNDSDKISSACRNVELRHDIAKERNAYTEVRAAVRHNTASTPEGRSKRHFTEWRSVETSPLPDFTVEVGSAADCNELPQAIGYLLNSQGEQSDTFEVGEVVSLNASSSYDPDGGSLEYQWFMNGNLILQVPDENITLRLPGSATVKLVVTDSAGAKDKQKFIIEVVERSEEVGNASVEFEGSSGWNIFDSQRQIKVDIDKIVNTSTTANSGSLKVKLWAASEPYSGSGSCCNGHILSEFLLGGGDPLLAGYYYYDITRTTSLRIPPDGTYHLVLILLEKTSESNFTIQDYFNFSKTITITNGVLSLDDSPGDGGSPVPNNLSGTDGVVRVNVVWDNDFVDIDLYVTDPCGNVISANQYRAQCQGHQGALDWDSQGGNGVVENIAWPVEAPRGNYSVELKYENGTQYSGTNYTVTVISGSTKQTYSGSFEPYDGHRITRTVANFGY